VGWILQIKKGREPDVVVDFTFEKGLLYVDILNIGDAPACNVAVSFEPEISGPKGTEPFSEMSLFRSLAFMPPQKKLTAFVSDYASYLARGQPTQIEVSISYLNRRGKRYQCKIRHDLEAYREMTFTL
jgi:hypothetical protein